MKKPDKSTRQGIGRLSRQCRQKTEEEGYASLMNNTKWKELCFAFAALEPHPTWRTRDLLNGHLSDWD